MGASQGGVLGNIGQPPRQGSYVVETCQKIISWAANHEYKWRRVRKKSEDKMQVHTERNIRGIYIPMLMDGGEGNIRIKGCVVKGIEHQREKKGKNNRTREDGEVCSYISMTRLKQGLEGGIGNRANSPKTIWEDSIPKHNPAWIMHAEKNMQDCGAPPLLDGDWSGLNPPVLLSDKNLTGATTNVLRRVKGQS